MSTRSRIGRTNADGTITSIYCHFDGYPSGVGKTLAAHYTDHAKIDALLALGDLSSLGAACDVGTTAYGRDRGEEDVGAQTHAADAWPDMGQDYEYLWDGAAWHVLRKGEWRPVADVIADDAEDE